MSHQARKYLNFRVLSALRGVPGVARSLLVGRLLTGRGMCLAWCVFGAAGCIGTDLVDETSLVDPEIRVPQASVALLRGGDAQLDAAYYDGFGNHDPFAGLVWMSSDPASVTVSATGRAMGVSSGQAEVTASVDDVTGRPILVTVVEDVNSAAMVSVVPDTLTLEAAGSSFLAVEVTNINGGSVTPSSIIWNSSDESVAVVSDQGEVVAAGPGTSNLVATVDNISSPPARIIVRGRTARGTFTKRPGTSYNVAGRVEVVELAGGRIRVDFLNDFLTSDGPDIDVYLSKTNQVTGTSVSLGNVQSTTGEQSYSVPTSVEFGEYTWVIIHCVAFNVTFGYASVL